MGNFIITILISFSSYAYAEKKVCGVDSFYNPNNGKSVVHLSCNTYFHYIYHAPLASDMREFILKNYDLDKEMKKKPESCLRIKIKSANEWILSCKPAFHQDNSIKAKFKLCKSKFIGPTKGLFGGSASRYFLDCKNIKYQIEKPLEKPKRKEYKISDYNRFASGKQTRIYSYSSNRWWKCKLKADIKRFENHKTFNLLCNSSLYDQPHYIPTPFECQAYGDNTSRASKGQTFYMNCK